MRKTAVLCYNHERLATSTVKSPQTMRHDCKRPAIHCTPSGEPCDNPDFL
ncbi:hypothetical protein [Mediterranea massiliensis]|nr:hypothetical protein [Mediterranea massiliensis]